MDISLTLTSWARFSASCVSMTFRRLLRASSDSHSSSNPSLMAAACLRKSRGLRWPQARAPWTASVNPSTWRSTSRYRKAWARCILAQTRALATTLPSPRRRKSKRLMRWVMRKSKQIVKVSEKAPSLNWRSDSQPSCIFAPLYGLPLSKHS